MKTTRQTRVALAAAGFAAMLSMTAQAEQIATITNDMVPPNARPGECYARALSPPAYKDSTETLLKRAAGERIEIIPAQYGWVEEKVLVREASEKVLEVKPAVYSTVTQQVLVKEASERMEEVPAVYETVTEQILVRPAYTMWKRGKGTLGGSNALQQVDNATGEIMCLVEVPAEYKTVEKRVLKSAAGTRRVPIPAVYETVSKQVMVKPPEVIKVQVPQEYRTVRVQKIVSAPQEKRIPIPAEYQTVTKRVLVSPGQMTWATILCDTNATPATITALQTALKAKGYNPGRIDGQIGWDTTQALRAFQKDNGLTQGQITMETLNKLGVAPISRSNEL